MINVFKIKKGLIKTNKNHIMPFYKKSKLTKKSLKVKIFRVYLKTLKSVPDGSILHYYRACNFKIRLGDKCLVIKWAVNVTRVFIGQRCFDCYKFCLRFQNRGP